MAGSLESNLWSAASNEDNLCPLIKTHKKELRRQITPKKNKRQSAPQQRGITWFQCSNHAFVVHSNATEQHIYRIIVTQDDT